MPVRERNRYVSKPGKHGTLYLYRAKYTCECDPVGFGEQSWGTYAYDAEHATEKFYDSDEGWKLVTEFHRVREA